jgi:ubiquinone/menaquinone biosynthesis C-methylase UbiE
MGLVDLDGVVPLLRCPRCRCRLMHADDGLQCGSSSCGLAARGSFRVVDRWPVLVDFETSVLEPEQVHAPSSGTGPAAHRSSIEQIPHPLRSWWKPRNRVAAANVEGLLSLLPDPAPLVLVIGGATVGNGVEALYATRRPRVVAFDIVPTPLVQFVADAHRIPLADASMDAVVVQAVLEHVLHPEVVVGEIHRVLRPNGLVYAETPFLQQVHAGPYDFTRYTSSGHRYLFRAFEEIAAGPVAGAGTQLLTSIDHLIRGLLRSELAGKLARAAFAFLRQLDRLVATSFAMDNASAYYFLGRRSDSQLTPREIVRYYRGAQSNRRHSAGS